MEKEGDVPRERCQLAFDSINNTSSIPEEVREQRKTTDNIAINITKYGSLLDKKLSDVKSLRTQVSEGSGSSSRPLPIINNGLPQTITGRKRRWLH